MFKLQMLISSNWVDMGNGEVFAHKQALAKKGEYEVFNLIIRLVEV